jgi:hypothetical protein
VKQRIEAVQRVYWAVLGLALVVIGLGLPLGNDGETMAVLDELTAFGSAFEDNRSTIEQSLLTSAKSTGAVALGDVQKAIGGDGVPKVTLDAAAPAIEPLAAIDLGTLSKIQALSEADPSLMIASARPVETGEALAWRIARATADAKGALTLETVALTLKAVSEDDVKRELETATTRNQLRAAEKTLAAKQTAHQKLADLYDSRRKWRATWKVLQRTAEERDEAKTAMDTAQTSRDALAARYEQLAKEADAAVAKATAAKTFGAARGDKHFVVAHAVLKDREAKAIELDVAVPVDVRAVNVPRITGAELPITRATPLWKEIEGGTSAAAIERVSKEFSWHYAYIQAGPIKIGGMTLIQFVSIAFLPLLLMLIRRSRRVASGYNPFDRDAGQLPRVGLGTPLNIVVLILLPFLGTVLCGISLVQLRQVPMVPMLCGVGILWLGITAHISLRDLVDLRDAVRQSHSAPPPAEKAAR